MAYDTSTIALRIKKLRGDVSQMEFAIQCGMTQAQVSGYELGKTLPGIEALAKMCAARGITIASFLEEKEVTSAPPRPPSKEEMALWVIRAIGIDGFPLDACRRALKGDRF